MSDKSQKDTMTPSASVIAPSAPGLSPEVVAVLQSLAAAITQNNQSQSQGMQSILEQFSATMAEQARIAREPIPENKVAPNVSAYNPLGERDHPRPGLKCDMYVGQYDDDGKIDAAYPILEDTSSLHEQVLCNALEQGEALVERNDGHIGKVIVQARRDGAGKLNRLIIAFPYGWLAKEFQAQLPSMKKILEQIVGKTAKELIATAAA